jgi:hypothetical protein
MDKVFTQTFNLQPRSSEELQAVLRRFEAKWQRRRRSHPLVGLTV